VTAAGEIPAQMARGWQGSGAYIGIDRWTNDVASAGTNFEALYPGITGFAVPEGTLAAAGHDASAYSQGVQVGPSAIDPANNILHNYRPGALGLHVNEPVPMASANALGNPQFGAGGFPQHFIPNLVDQVGAGKISITAADGSVLPATIGHDAATGAKWIEVHPSPGQVIHLTNLDVPAGSTIQNSKIVGDTVKGGATVFNGVVNIGTGLSSVGSLASSSTYK